MIEPATLLLVRHGQIRANRTGRWHGSTDTPMTRLGRRQANLTGRYLASSGRAIAAIYSSPLERSKRTAHVIGRHHGLEPREEPRLREYGIGELEGTTFRELHATHAFFQRIIEDAEYAPPGGESIVEVASRMRESMLWIADRHPGEVALIVGHGAALAIALAQFLDGNPLAWTNYHVENCSMTELVLHPKPRLISFNVTDHL